MDNEVCWLIETPDDPPRFQVLLDLLREDVPGACVAEHSEDAGYTVFSVLGSMPSLRRWADAGVPIWDIAQDAKTLSESYEFGADEGEKREPEITRRGAFSVQVCVPEDWPDKKVRKFACRKVPSGTTSGWEIRREGDEALKGDPERQPCDDREGFVHIMLDA